MSRTLTAALCGLALLAGCDDHSFPLVGGGGGGGEGVVRSDWLGVQIFMDQQCETCHAGSAPLGDLVLPGDVLADMANLDEPATSYPELVIPGDPERSYLWLVVSYAEGVPGMPPVGAPHPDADVVRQWIEDGAILD